MLDDEIEPHERSGTWLQRLKIGDEVCISGRWQEALEKITHATANFVVVGRTKFNRKSGYETGGGARLRIYEPTAEDREKIECRQLQDRFTSLNWREMPLERLRALAQALDAALIDPSDQSVDTEVVKAVVDYKKELEKSPADKCFEGCSDYSCVRMGRCTGKASRL